ncbi:hypothetical protein V2J09_002605 [Rumex salicifolius]
MMDFGAPSFIRNIFDIPRQLTKLSIFSDDCIGAAYLKVPGGLEYKVVVERKSGDIFFSNGWRDFADHYALDSGYFLVFYYQGSSRFHVGIADTSNCEIDYTKFHCQCPHDDHSDGEETEEEESIETGKESMSEALERAELHKCDGPSFIVSMNISYVSHDYRMWVPLVHGHRYLKKGYSKARLVVERVEGATATCKVKVRSGPTCVRFCEGWSKFVERNRLEVDDVCKFELVDRKNQTYMVHIFRSGGL